MSEGTEVEQAPEPRVNTDIVPNIRVFPSISTDTELPAKSGSAATANGAPQATPNRKTPASPIACRACTSEVRAARASTAT